MFRTLLLASVIHSVLAQTTGSKVCAACHADIYRRYSETGMARSSGSIGAGSFHESFERAAFTDPVTGIAYRVLAAGGEYRLDFSQGSEIRGERLLRYFIGSGNAGRSYLFSLDGFLFQAPVSYYSKPGKWDVSPGFQRYSSLNLTRPIETGCLNCHASRLQPIAGTQNGFRGPPFLEGGIGCERCHGAGQDHVARMSAGRKSSNGIVNPAKLEPARRDSVCAQCHLTGAARNARIRPAHDTYRPGELLSTYSAFYVWSGPASMKVTSHFERFEQSRCKKAAGDRFWCGTCHDVHGEVRGAERASWYRARCERCHQPAACKAPHDARLAANDDCIACHMPKSPVRDTEHAVYTDHSIPRQPADSSRAVESHTVLRPFWKTPPDERDFALAYATVAISDPSLNGRALELLEKANRRDPGDNAVAVQLAQLYDQTGDAMKAIPLYERALAADPSQVTAALNLGTLHMQAGRAAEAMRLWRDVLQRNPGLTGARVNLAVAQYRSGDRSAAEASLKKALEIDPGSTAARGLLAEIQAK